MKNMHIFWHLKVILLLFFATFSNSKYNLLWTVRKLFKVITTEKSWTSWPFIEPIFFFFFATFWLLLSWLNLTKLYFLLKWANCQNKESWKQHIQQCHSTVPHQSPPFVLSFSVKSMIKLWALKKKFLHYSFHEIFLTIEVETFFLLSD